MEPNGTLPTSQTFNISTTNPASIYYAIGWPINGTIPSWASIESGTGQSFRIKITSSAQTLSPGTYSTTVRVVSGTSPNASFHDIKDIPITLKIASITTDPSNIILSATNGSSSNTEPLNISYSLGSSSWQASVNYKSGSGWLNLSSLSGSNLPEIINVYAIGQTDGLYEADIIITADGSTKTIPVTYTVGSPGVNFVAPYVGTSSRAGDVIIRGLGFNALASITVSFGSTAATSINLISDTEIHASYPAMSQGVYPINVSDGGTALTTKANLNIIDPPTYAYTAIARSGNFSEPIYDAKRKAIYIQDDNYNYSPRGIERYTFNGSSWISSILAVSASPTSIMMGPHGDELLRLDRIGMAHINLDSFTQIFYNNAYTSGFLGTNNSINSYNDRFALTSDGFAIGSASKFSYKYDITNKKFIKTSQSAPSANKWVKASSNLSKIYYIDISFNREFIEYYNSSTEQYLPTSFQTNATFNSVSINRDSTKIIYSYRDSAGHNSAVYDSSFNLLGTLPIINGINSNINHQSVISNDGLHAYIWLSSTNSIYKYDLTSLDVNGNYTQIGAATSLTDIPGTNARMGITPDDGTLMIVGSAYLIVMPTP